MEYLFVREIVIIFFIALVGGYLAIKLKQPPLSGYLVGGILLSLPVFSSLVYFDISRNLAQVGVALLLFATGVEFHINKLLTIKRTVLFGAVIQLILFILILVAVFPNFGFSRYEALFLSAAFSNSATVVILQILEKEGKRDFKTSETVISWLILQDIAMVVIAVLIGSISNNSNFGTYDLLEAVAKSIVFVGLSLILGKKLIPHIFEAVSKLNSSEILLILSFVFCLVVAYFAEAIGLSYTIGAFLAGLMISESFVNHEIFSEVKPLRNLFSAVFFVALGSLLSPTFLMGNILRIILVLFGLLIIKIVTTFIVTLFFEKQSKSAFVISLMLMQGGEFSFILSQIGIENSWISSEFYSLIIVVTIISIILTPFVIERSESWYYKIKEEVRKRNRRIYRLLFDKFEGVVDIDQPGLSNHVVICGYGRVGSYIGRALQKSHIPFIVVDSDTETIDFCKKRGIKIIFGDASNIDILEKADIERASTLVIALSEEMAVEIVTLNARKLNPNIKIIARSHVPTDDERLKSKGVSITVEPEFEAAVSIAKKIFNFYGKTGVDVGRYLEKSRRRQRSKMGSAREKPLPKPQRSPLSP